MAANRNVKGRNNQAGPNSGLGHLKEELMACNKAMDGNNSGNRNDGGQPADNAEATVGTNTTITNQPSTTNAVVVNTKRIKL